jgi:hypothetical protein
MKITTATAIGFAVMGFIGFFVRLVHIPINRILLGTLLLCFWERYSIVLQSACSVGLQRAPSVCNSFPQITYREATCITRVWPAG